MLEFRPETHEYRWRGAPVPSVTQVIRAALGDPFPNVPQHVLERKRQIGTAAHLACHLDDQGELDEASVHPAVRPYLDAWRRFRMESGCEVIVSERALYHETHGYAGQLDRYVRINGTLGIVDIKSGNPGACAGLQTAAYAALVDAEYGAHDRPLQRFALQALPNGRYRMHEYTSPADWRNFLACLAVYRMKEEQDGNDHRRVAAG